MARQSLNPHNIWVKHMQEEREHRIFGKVSKRQLFIAGIVT
jgi:hypothetical protein